MPENKFGGEQPLQAFLLFLLTEFLAVICLAEVKDRDCSLLLDVLAGLAHPRWGEASQGDSEQSCDTAMTCLIPCCFLHLPVLSLSPLKGTASEQKESLMAFIYEKKLALITVSWRVTKPRWLQ